MTICGFYLRFFFTGCLVFCVLIFGAWSAGNILIAPANRRVALASQEFPLVESTIVSASGSRIAAWYLPANDARATIVLLHPLRSDRRSMLDRARLFHRAGYAVVMIDFQAHGESSGPHITFGHLERDDVRAAVDYARDLNPNHRIGIIGRSLGGAAALLASPLGVDAIVLESVYPSIAEAVDNRVSMRVGPLSAGLSPLLLWQIRPRIGISASELRPIDNIVHAETPVLIAGGELDRHTTLAETQRLFDAALAPKKLVVFEGADHRDLFAYDPKTYRREILAFLSAYLTQ